MGVLSGRLLGSVQTRVRQGIMSGDQTAIDPLGPPLQVRPQKDLRRPPATGDHPWQYEPLWSAPPCRRRPIHTGIVHAEILRGQPIRQAGTAGESRALVQE